MNYGELKALVKKYLETDETSFNTYIGQFVRLAEEEIYRRVQLPDLSKTVAVTFTASQELLDMQDDFLSPFYLAVNVSGERQMLLDKEQSFLREVYSGVGSQGVPRFFTVFNDTQLLLAPAPDQNYTGELNYYYRPDSLADGADSGTSWVSVNGENALLFGTIVQGYVYLKGDESTISSYKEKYETAVTALEDIAEGRNRKDVYRRPDARRPV